MPRTARLRPFDADELAQLHIAVTARLEQLEAIDPGDVAPETIAIVRRLDQEIGEAWRPL